MAKSLHQTAAGTVRTVCNAESEAGNVSKSAVLEIIARQRAAFEFLNVSGGLSPDSTCRFSRERWEIVQGKLMCLDSVANLISELPASPAAAENFTGGKSISFPFGFVDTCRNALLYGIDALDWYAPDQPVADLARLRLRSCIVDLDAGQATFDFSGNAGKQPEPGEEARPLMGTPPVTAAAPSPSVRDLCPKSGPVPMELIRQLEGLSSSHLSAVSQLIADELAARGSAIG